MIYLIILYRRISTILSISDKTKGDSMLVPGHRYKKSDLYTILKVPVKKQRGSWNTGYLKYNDEIFIFANIGIAGRTGHDYNNHWSNQDLVWFGDNNSNLRQPQILYMLEPGTIVHLFTREGNRDPFTYHGVGNAINYYDEVPVKIIWQINKPVIINKVNESTLSKNIRQAKNDDINDRVIGSYRRRKGQKEFSNNLFIVYNGKCCITGCDVEAVLHACHIAPHAESGNNSTTNGLLLRSDIHDLFDMHQIGIHPTTCKVHVKKTLHKTMYGELDGRILASMSNGEKPNREALKKRWQLFKKK